MLDWPGKVIWGFSVFGLLFGAALFNPTAFNLKEVRDDFVNWIGWLNRGTVYNDKGKIDEVKTSWSNFHDALVDERKTGIRWYSMLLPSKEMLMSVVLLAIVSDAMRKHDWHGGHIALLALPVGPASFLLLFYLILKCPCCKAAGAMWVSPAVGVFFVCLAEIAAVQYFNPSLTTPEWIGLTCQIDVDTPPLGARSSQITRPLRDDRSPWSIPVTKAPKR